MSKNSTAVSNVIPFNFEAREVRTLLIDDQPWFVASDLANALEYGVASAMTRHLDEDEKGVSIVHTLGGEQEMLIINESGLYSAILRSRKASSKRFKKWVTAEVLPAIRKHGRYEDRRNTMCTLIGQTIGTDGFHCLAAVLDGKVRHLPAPARKRAKQHVWSQVHKAFSVVSAQDIPSDQMDGARNFIAAYAIEGEWLGKEEPAAPKPQRLDIHCPVSELVEKRPDMMRVRSGITDTLDVNLQDFMKLSVTPCEQILHTLCNAGYEIEAAWFEIRTYRNKLYDLESCIRGLSYSFGSDQQYVIDGRRPQQTA